jgi:hypothetical protein
VDKKKSKRIKASGSQKSKSLGFLMVKKTAGRDKYITRKEALIFL